jgi:nitroreductase
VPDHDVHELILRRWSPRAYDPARPVPQETLRRLFEAARWAPSSFNEQPWRFVVVDRDAAPEVRRQLLATLSAANQTWANAAPVLVLAVLRLALAFDGSPNRLAWYDTGQAVALMSMQATAEGLSLRQMQGFDRTGARAACQVPAGFEPAVVIAVGYPGDPAQLPTETHRVAETQPRRRKSVDQFVSWGTGLFSTDGA